MDNKKHIQSIIDLKNNVILMMLFDIHRNNNSLVTLCDVRLLCGNKTVNIININYNLPYSPLGMDAHVYYIAGIHDVIVKFSKYNEEINNEFKNNNINIKNTKYYFNNYTCYIKNESSKEHYFIEYNKSCMYFSSSSKRNKTISRFTTDKNILLNNRMIKLLLSELNKFKNSIEI